ncbi:LacI family DNA-binding transcriptional regulator [Rubellicoccus peritrichatus]|uniref:LacI family DNA-binding transcriptional regulator n=1 Tax=Rubellicoccus peritrichatus TaxID=3080537 RepID=A0AAQ3L7M6_9BACT|nr:LacI family DNA-binding transcriptional regulator [Puniceicoccus sp. CR14]WOO40745.1 LacI family DNA-binding transcriptional regulator [Puniceicoccus sp. CR14]
MKNQTYEKTTATLVEVANKAGVSRQTASRILGGNADKHKAATVDKVHQVANELGYRPNLLAKSIVSGRTYSIGILIPSAISHDVFFAQVISGIQQKLAETDLIPIFLHSSERHPEHQQIHRLVDRRVDGILLIPHATNVSLDYFNEIVNRNIPVVCINEKLHNVKPVDFVGTDEFKGGQAAAEFLLQNGHTRLCSLRVDQSFNLGMRHDGFEKTATAAGASCQSVSLPGWSLEENMDLLCDFLQKPKRPTAFFAVTDLYAAMLYKAAEKLGLKIPQDFSVIGFADNTLAQYLSPSLTTLRQQGKDIGILATTALLKRINGSKARIQNLTLPAELIQRDSVAPVKKKRRKQPS